METQTYWKENGKHQADCDVLLAKMAEAGMDRTKLVLPGNEEWAVLNGMAGIYYGYFNDGDGISGAIDNNRVHGFNSLSDFLDVCEAVHAPVTLTQFLTSPHNTPRTYEDAMDAAIVIAAARHLRQEPLDGSRGGPHLSVQPLIRKKTKRTRTRK